MTFNRAALIKLTPVDWCNVVLSDDVSINNVTFWRRNIIFDDVTINVTLSDEPRKGCVKMAVEKNAKVVRVAVLWSHFSREVGGFRQ